MDDAPLLVRQGWAVEFLRSEINRWEDYHTHKEQMAWGATVLFLTAATTLAFLRLPQLSSSSVSNWVLSGAIVLTAASGICFVCWQLGLRELAAKIQEACGSVEVEWLKAPPNDEALGPSGDPGDRRLPKAVLDKLGDLRGPSWWEGPRVARVLTIVPMGALSIAALFHLVCSLQHGLFCGHC